jgi:hypothetical protein
MWQWPGGGVSNGVGDVDQIDSAAARLLLEIASGG